jgi:hypothetical protein
MPKYLYIMNILRGGGNHMDTIDQLVEMAIEETYGEGDPHIFMPAEPM